MKQIIKNIKSLISKMDKPLLFVTLVFFVFGLLNIVTASSREAVVRYELSTYYYFYRQLFMIIAGLIGAYVIINFRSSHYKDIIKPIYVFAFLLVIALFKFGIEVNGATNWLPLPGLGTIQPSEFAKPVLIVLIAVYFERYNRIFASTNYGEKYKIVGKLLVALALIPIMTFLQKDLGTVLIMFGIFAVMFLCSPLLKIDKLRIILLVIGVGIVGMAGLYLKQGYILSEAQMSRFDYINPCAKYETNGYQVCNGFIALNDGGLFGLGIGKSKQKYSYIPEPHTDSVFAIIGEEYGVIRCTFIFAAYLFILYRILKISVKANTIRGRYICLGVAIYIFMHIFINLGGLFGLIPLTGVPLPFLSYGGSYAISLMCSLALVQRVAIEIKTQKIKVS